MRQFDEMPAAFRTAVIYTALISITVIVLNRLTTGYLWCIYPIFGMLWWPLSAYFQGRHDPLRFALCGAGLLSALFLLTYIISSFGAHPWFLYPMLGVFWWPLGVWGATAGARKFSIAATQYIVITLLLINLLTSPQVWWWQYPTVLVIWWPLSLHLHHIHQKEGEPS